MTVATPTPRNAGSTNNGLAEEDIEIRYIYKNTSHNVRAMDRQFEWDGSESLRKIFSYSHHLGPRETQEGGEGVCFPLYLRDVNGLIDVYRHAVGNEMLPSPRLSHDEANAFQRDLISRLDSFWSSAQLPRRCFMKTNRHSCKDAVLDHPSEKDLGIFRVNIKALQHPPADVALDDIDFTGAFEAMCRARIQATAVTCGADVVSLLSRSRRVYEDFELQLRPDIGIDDFYLFFCPFDDEMAQRPMHEFRCYVSGRQLRCIAQYSYLTACPIAEADMSAAATAIAFDIVNDFIPQMPDDVSDAAVDVQCFPVDFDCASFTVRRIEVNPLGPGTVWGTLDWEHDSPWLLGKEPPPESSVRRDTQGEKLVRELMELSSTPGSGQIAIPCVVAYIAKKSCLGVCNSALAHMPPDYMLILWEEWGLAERAEVRTAYEVGDPDPHRKWCVIQ